MKAIRLTIKNVGMVKDTSLSLDKPLIMLFGDLAQGKTTHLNAFKWMLGGAFPTDIIRHGEKEASVLFEFQEAGGPGSISRSWYINKEGVTTARSVSFIRAGKPVSDPAKAIKAFLNPYLLDNDFLKKMNEKEQGLYLLELFGVDTSDLDKEIDKAAAEAKTLRVKIGMYGTIDTTEVKPVDAEALKVARGKTILAHDEGLESVRRELVATRKAHNEILEVIDQANREVFVHNGAVTSHENDADGWLKTIADLETRLATAKVEVTLCKEWLERNPRKEENQRPTPIDTSLLEAKLSMQPDTAEVDAQISQAAVDNLKHEQYQKNLKRAEEKKADEKKLSDLEASQRGWKKDKLTRLATKGKESGIEGLVFLEGGSFEYKGTSAGMLSTSQIGDLSQELSALYPAGFGLDLIDRAESLGFGIGKNILEFVEKAKREDKTILAAIVGERPAEVPLEVGVWVIENGEAK
jgi:hypothetical protein